MPAYDVTEWSDLYVAAAGASAALAGLLFVAISINIERILGLEGLPERALQTLLQLLAALVFSLLVLAPGQAIETLGIELLALAIPLVTVSFALVARSFTPGVEGPNPAARYAVVALGTVPFAVAGLSLLLGEGGGLYWVLAGTILALIGAVLNAWVLMVEILR